nr:hypothetical protein [uncultured Methylophaga sp.]
MRIHLTSPQRILKMSLLMLFTLLLMGCDDTNAPSPQTPKQHQLTELSQKNINAYTNEMVSNYIKIQDQLIQHYQQAKQNNNIFEFIQYRNHTWTPEYISLKNKYSRDFKHNEPFLNGQPSAPLFTIYENLIYIGLDLKNGLLEDDEVRQQSALEAAKEDRELAISIQQQLK